MAKNAFGKSRKPGNAYVVLEGGGWKWEILKLYKSPEASLKDPYARAFCYVHGVENDYGDVYLREIPGSAAWLNAMAYNARSAGGV